MRILLKIGGAQLEHPDARARLCEAIAAARTEGHELVIVHGGGNQIRELCQKIRLEDRYHEGLRITDEPTADAVLMVLGGKVNRLLVAALERHRVPAVGISGADGSSFRAVPLQREGVDLGYVGRIDTVNPTLVTTLLAAGYVPVTATVAPDEHGTGPFYNLNADHAASPLCRAFGCDALLFLTDVPGVLDENGRTIATLTPAACERLVARGTARGGMLPKLDAALQALRENPNALVKIVPANLDDCVRAALRSGIGTRLQTTEPSTEEQHG